MFRHSPPGPREGADRRARRLRSAGGRIEQRCLREAAEGREPPGSGRARARRGAGGTRGGRPRRDLCRGHADPPDRAGQAERAGEGRRLHPRAGGRPRDRRSHRRRGDPGRYPEGLQHDRAGRSRPGRQAMTTLAGHSSAAMLSRRWRDPAAWRTTVDVVAILLALSLPWSTSLVSIFGVVLMITMVPFLDIEAFVASLKRPICLAPIALFVLALVGTLWSDAAWGARFYAVGPAAK